MTELEEKRCERLGEKLKQATTIRELYHLGKQIKKLKKIKKQRQRKLEKRFL